MTIMWKEKKLHLRSAVRFTVAALCASAALSSFAAKEVVADFAQKLPITLQGDSLWWSISIPMEVQMSAAHADLRDLRVLDANGEAMAFALQSTAAGPSTDAWREGAVRLFPLRAPVVAGTPQANIRVEQNGTLVEVRTATPTGQAAEQQQQQQQKLYGWLIDASKVDFALDRLELDWSSASDGFQNFRIEASDDLQHWRDWGSGQIARLSFEGEGLDVNEVKLPGQKARYLRLLWPSDAASAVQLRGARVLGSTRVAAQTPLIWSAPLTGKQEKDGEYRWSLPQALPLQRVRVTLAESLNYTVAPVDLSGRNLPATTPVGQRRERDDNYWYQLARGVLYRLPVDGKTVQVDELQLASQQPVNELRLRVDSRGAGLGPQAPQISVAMRASRLVFLARGSAPYVLAFSNPNARAADLPLAVLIPNYNPDKPPVWGNAALAPLSAAVQPATQAKAQSAQDWKKYGLWAVLLLGVGLLAAMAMSLMKKKT